MINTITIIPAPGINYAYNSALAFVKPIVVSNETAVYAITGSATGTGCRYAAAEGRVYFENNFDGTQKVYIIYKT